MFLEEQCRRPTVIIWNASNRQACLRYLHIVAQPHYACLVFSCSENTRKETQDLFAPNELFRTVAASIFEYPHFG